MRGTQILSLREVSVLSLSLMDLPMPSRMRLLMTVVGEGLLPTKWFVRRGGDRIVWTFLRTAVDFCSKKGAAKETKKQRVAILGTQMLGSAEGRSGRRGGMGTGEGSLGS